MLSKDQMVAGMGAAVDQITAMCRDHEEHAHNGAPCPANRLSTVAYLAHRLGVKATPEAGEAVVKYLREYERECPHCQPEG